MSLVLAITALGGGSAGAADLPSDVADALRRGVAAVGPSSSAAPALREAGRTGEPSPGFRLGAALGAWINASLQLDFDRANPAGAGPPHVSQTGGDPDAFAEDCREETTAFAQLDAGARTLGARPDQVVAAANADLRTVSAWRTRQAGPPAPCR